MAHLHSRLMNLMEIDSVLTVPKKSQMTNSLIYLITTKYDRTPSAQDFNLVLTSDDNGHFRMDLTLKEKVVLFGIPQIKREDCLGGLRVRVEQRAGAVVRRISGESRLRKEEGEGEGKGGGDGMMRDVSGGANGNGSAKGEAWKDDVVFMFKGL